MYAIHNVPRAKYTAVRCNTSRIDVIGDIHGQLRKVQSLLVAMGYPEEDDCFGSHRDDRLQVYLGDYVDRGPDNLGVSKRIQGSVERGFAKGILGNHEFNAVRWTMRDPINPGEFLRAHTPKNLSQHIGFLNEGRADPIGYDAAIKWFKTLPVYLICGDYRFVHACWHQQSIDLLHRHECLDDEGRLTDRGWALHPQKDQQLLHALEILLKGPTEELGNGFGFKDFYGERRTKARTAWWKKNPETYADAFCSLPKNAPFRSLPYNPDCAHPLSDEIAQGLDDLPPDARVFFGHIWLDGLPHPLSDRVACVDYSSSQMRGIQMAYRTVPGETTLRASNFFWVPNP